MTTTVSLSFASVNIDCADPAGLADFWGKVLGRPVSPGVTPGVMAVDAPDSGSGLQMIFHPATEAGKGTGGFRPTLLTDHHDEETERLAGLGAKLVNEAYHPPIRLTLLADPEGNPFNLATWQPE
jgi:predicted enzyme related to lactoylglutathione lyase